MEDGKNTKTRRGWPRPWVLFRWRGSTLDSHATSELDGTLLPEPYINGATGKHQRWLEFNAEAAKECADERRCTVCGDVMEGKIAYGAFQVLNGRTETSGPGAHPRCLVLAVKVCPHFRGMVQKFGTDSAVVCLLYERGGLGANPYREGSSPWVGGNVPVADDVKRLTADGLDELARVDPLGTA